MSLLQGHPEGVGMNPDKLNRIVDLTHSWVDRDFTPMVISSIARRGTIVLQDAYGRLNTEANSPDVDMNSIYPMASISKVMTATIAMTFVEEGLLSLTRPVQEYIPEFIGENKEMVMVHNLFTHTSGINDGELRNYIKSNENSFKMPELDSTQHPEITRRLNLGYNAPLWKMPGEEMSYSGFGFEILSEIIRRVSGKSLECNARERIFDPLGMNDTYFVLPESKYSRVVGFPKDSYCGDWFNTPAAYETPSAGGGMYSTAGDMMKFGQMFLNKGIYDGKRILSRAAVDTMTRNHIPGVQSAWGKFIFKEAIWGLGWILAGNKKDESGILRSQDTFYHTGAGCSILLVDPVNELVEVNFTISMVRLPNGEPLRRFDHITDIAIGSIEDES